MKQTFHKGNDYINVGEWIEMADNVFKVELPNLK
jgi:hypothetical protein